jgi:YD repeat-containing protein
MTGESKGGSTVVSHTYDATGKKGLLSTTTDTNSYTVDGVGNRTAQTVGGTSSSFTYDNDDELTQVTGGLTRWYGYNANGDQTERATSTGPHGSPVYALYSYDYDDQRTTGSGITYAYDALGRRTGSTTGGTTTAYQYDGDGVLLETQGGSVTASYTTGNALLRKDGETPMFDGLGSERTVTNSSGVSAASLTLSAFG